MRIRILALAGTAAVLLSACSHGGEADAEASVSTSSTAGSSTSAPGSVAPGSDANGSVANGEAARTGQQVAADAADALETAGSVHLTTTGSADGTTPQMDLQVQGDEVAGTVSSNGLTMQYVRTGGQSYARASADFWQQNGAPEATARRLDGAWVAVPGSVGGAVDEFGLSRLADTLRTPADATYDEQVTTGTVEGVDVVDVDESDGSTLTVAATGVPYPLRQVTGGADAATLTYDGFGTRQTITAPPGALPLGQLTGG